MPQTSPRAGQHTMEYIENAFTDELIAAICSPAPLSFDEFIYMYGAQYRESDYQRAYDEYLAFHDCGIAQQHDNETDSTDTAEASDFSPLTFEEFIAKYGDEYPESDHRKVYRDYIDFVK